MNHGKFPGKIEKQNSKLCENNLPKFKRLIRVFVNYEFMCLCCHINTIEIMSGS